MHLISIIFTSTLLLFDGLIGGAYALDPFSGLDEFLRLKSDLRQSEGDVGYYADTGFLAVPGSGETRMFLTLAIPDAELLHASRDDSFHASYRVSLYWKDEETLKAAERSWDRVLDRSRECEAADTMHVFQSSVTMKPGRYKVEVEVEDRNAHRYGQVSFQAAVPDFRGKTPSISSIILLSGQAGEVIQEIGRPSSEGVEPRAMGVYRYSMDPVGYYVEVYPVAGDTALKPLEVGISAVDSAGKVLWERREPLGAGGSVRVFRGKVEGRPLEIGGYRFKVVLSGASGEVIAGREKPFFVSSSPRWIEDHFESVVKYLRYIAGHGEMDELKSARGDQRLEAWRKFWDKRDPLPATPANEAMLQYFGRIRYVNRNFSTHLERGWKTDRGRAYLALGPPDEVLRRDWVTSPFGTMEIWVYDRSIGFKTILYFLDRGITGDYRLLNPGDYIRAKSRLE